MMSPSHAAAAAAAASSSASRRGVAASRCPHPILHTLQLAIPFVVMVSLNAAAGVLFDRAATDGFAMSYVQPDGRTFGVWGAIYTALLVLCFHAPHVAPRARAAMSYSFLLNGAWLLANGAAVREGLSYWLAVVVLAAYLAQLVVAYRALGVDYARASWRRSLTVLAPVSMNAAWVTLASALNFSNTAMPRAGVDYSLPDNRCVVGGPDWAMAVLGLAALVAVYLALERADVVYGAVVVWALLGVVRHQTEGSGFRHPVSPTLRSFAHGLVWFVAVGCVVGALKHRVARWLGAGGEQAEPEARVQPLGADDSERSRGEPLMVKA